MKTKSVLLISLIAFIKSKDLDKSQLDKIPAADCLKAFTSRSTCPCEISNLAAH